MPKVSNKIKILFCMNRIIMGGSEKVLCQYLLALKKISNIEVSVVSKKKVTDPYFINFFKTNKIKLIDNFFNIKNKFLFIKLGQEKRDKINKFINFWTWRKLKSNNDIFIDFTDLSFFEEFKNTNKKKFAWFHNSVVHFMTYHQGQIEQNVYNKVICLSESFKQDLISSFPNLEEKIDYIYNPIDIENAKQLAEQKPTIEITSPYFVAIQRLDNFDKDVGTIIEAFNQYSLKDDTTKLYIVGDGPDKEQLMALAQNNKNIIFTGQLDNPYPLIKNAQALILSSTKRIGEGLPNTLLEAQVLETLAISSDVKSGVRELLLGGKAGLLFEVENPQSLADTLVYAKEHPDECKQMVQTATENLNRFSVENAVKKFIKLCDIDIEEELINA